MDTEIEKRMRTINVGQVRLAKFDSMAHRVAVVVSLYSKASQRPTLSNVMIGVQYLGRVISGICCSFDARFPPRE